MEAKIQFLGAAQTVTGSRILLSVNDTKILIDCGLFQGNHETRALNWEPFPVDPSEISAVILTHGHIDHIGYLPKLVQSGYAGPVYASPATVDICHLSLPDSAKLQEEEARYANKKGYSRYSPAKPLYTVEDAKNALKRLLPIRYEERKSLSPHLSFRLLRAGHILGSSFIEIVLPDGKKLLISGDLGRVNQPIIRDPQIITHADYLTIESTYGDRLHGENTPHDRLAEIINETIHRGGSIIIPSFAIGRTQDLLYYLNELEDSNRIPVLPIYIDSPMAVDATRLYARHSEEHDLEMQTLLENDKSPFSRKNIVLSRNRDDSKRLNKQTKPSIIISSSGMLNGGRILHHIALRAPDPKNTILFVGYQAEGTKGRKLLDGAEELRVYGEMVPIRAKVDFIHELSAHADYQEILNWLSHFQAPPIRTFIVHGEPPAQESLNQKIKTQLGWNTSIPKRGDIFELK